MPMGRRKHSPVFKARAAFAAVKGYERDVQPVISGVASNGFSRGLDLPA